MQMELNQVADLATILAALILVVWAIATHEVDMARIKREAPCAWQYIDPARAIIESDHHLTLDQAERIHDQLKKAAQTHRPVILERGLRIVGQWAEPTPTYNVGAAPDFDQMRAIAERLRASDPPPPCPHCGAISGDEHAIDCAIFAWEPTPFWDAFNAELLGTEFGPPVTLPEGWGPITWRCNPNHTAPMIWAYTARASDQAFVECSHNSGIAESLAASIDADPVEFAHALIAALCEVEANVLRGVQQVEAHT